jgi:CRISPR system Cascade subunit CasD
VALSLVDDQKPGLDDAVSALVEPFRPLFLGRVCCPPAGPIYQEETMEADSVHQVLSRTPLMSRSDRDVDAYVAEWPAEPSIAVEQEGLQLKKRYDLRDWSNNVHAGSRYVVRGRVTPPRP